LEKHKLVSGKESILVPLCGDCAFIPYAVNKGHLVAGCEFTSLAVHMLKNRFNNVKFTTSDFDWGTLHKMESATHGQESKLDDVKMNGSLTVFETDILKLPVKQSSFDLIYDKDALGAIPIKLREEYLNIVNASLRPGGHTLLEVKLKNDADFQKGPPFHFTKESVLKYFGDDFELIDHIVGIYDLGKPGWTQQAFILRKKDGCK